jgi:hypothetical protein
VTNRFAAAFCANLFAYLRRHSPLGFPARAACAAKWKYPKALVKKQMPLQKTKKERTINTEGHLPMAVSSLCWSKR